jgi:hypothetical protein
MIGAVSFYFAFGKGVVKLYEARDWTPTPCTILSSEVQSHGDTYSIEVRFSYSVKGKIYESNRYDFLESSSSGYDSKAEVVRGIPAGSRTTCYVNPQDPVDAVLERCFTSDMYFAFIPLFFAMIGFIGMYFAITTKMTLSGRSKKDISVVPESRGMKVKSSPTARFIGLLCVTLFWNGIVSVFLWQAFKTWQSDDPEYFLMIFLIPFVLVGLGLIAGVGYSFLSLFNPRLEVSMSPQEIILGGTIHVSWKINGNVQRIKQFQIRLEGTEEAQYRRGTTNYTDREIFFTKEIFQTASAYNVGAGSVSVQIPENSMHSLDTGNNKILWTIHIQGSIHNWPDVSETYEITVLPLG